MLCQRTTGQLAQAAECLASSSRGRKFRVTGRAGLVPPLVMRDPVPTSLWWSLAALVLLVAASRASAPADGEPVCVPRCLMPPCTRTSVTLAELITLKDSVPNKVTLKCWLFLPSTLTLAWGVAPKEGPSPTLSAVGVGALRVVHSLRDLQPQPGGEWRCLSCSGTSVVMAHITPRPQRLPELARSAGRHQPAPCSVSTRQVTGASR